MVGPGIGGQHEVSPQERSGSADYGGPVPSVIAVVNSGEQQRSDVSGPAAGGSDDYVTSETVRKCDGHRISGQGVFSAAQMARIRHCVAEAAALGEPMVPWGIANRPE